MKIVTITVTMTDDPADRRTRSGDAHLQIAVANLQTAMLMDDAFVDVEMEAAPAECPCGTYVSDEQFQQQAGEITCPKCDDTITLDKDQANG